MTPHNELITEYLLYLEHNLGRARGTLDNYGRDLNRLAVFLQTKGKTLPKADLLLLETFAGIEAHNRGVSPSGRKLIVAAIRGFYAWLHKHQLIKTNTAEHLKYPRAVKTLPVPISPSNAEKLLNSIPLDKFIDVRDAAIIALFLSTGLRLSGLRNLNESNLFEMEVDKEQKLFIRVTEKRNKERIIPVPDVMRIYIMFYLHQPEFKQANRVTESGEKVLFINTKNNRVKLHEFYGEKRRLSTRYIEKIIHQRGAAVGISPKELRPHAMRHLYGTELAESGVDLHRIQLLLGHADLRTTTQYIHLAQRELFRIVNTASPIAKMRTVAHSVLEQMEGKRRKS